MSRVWVPYWRLVCGCGRGGRTVDMNRSAQGDLRIRRSASVSPHLSVPPPPHVHHRYTSLNMCRGADVLKCLTACLPAPILPLKGWHQLCRRQLCLFKGGIRFTFKRWHYLSLVARVCSFSLSEMPKSCNEFNSIHQFYIHQLAGTMAMV